MTGRAGVADSGADACTLDEGCITCGDVAVPVTVVAVDMGGEASGADARCRDDQGREELVATELVGPVGPGDRLLVHAGVAIERLEPAPTPVSTTAPTTASTTAPTPVPTTEGRPDAFRR